VSTHAVPELDTCGCCEQRVPRPRVYNRPGLAELEYRVGVHGTFLRRMLALLPNWPPRVAPSGQNGDGPDAPPLTRLTTRSGDDPSIAVLDAWATLADVLTFYQERIANEGFLRTATERRSVLELSRTIGYELNPGVAAGTFLAFMVEDREPPPGIPPVRESLVPKGTKVQSLPGQGQLPQTFETSAGLVARPEWNEFRPRLTMPQPVGLGSTELFVAGVATGLERGDRILISGPPKQPSPPDPPIPGVEASIHKVMAVEPDAERARTRLVLQTLQKLPPSSKPPAPTKDEPVLSFTVLPPPPPNPPKPVPPAQLDDPVFELRRRPMTADEIRKKLLNTKWPDPFLYAQILIFGWAIDEILKFLGLRGIFLDFTVEEWVEVEPARDTRRPTVVSTFPNNGDQNVPPNTTLMVTFNEPMDGPSAMAAVKIRADREDGAEVSAVTKSFDPVTATVRVVPRPPPVPPATTPPPALDSDRTYYIVVETSALDKANNQLAAKYRSSFTVINYVPPGVVKRSPVPGAPNQPANLDEVTAEFSEPVKGVTRDTFFLRDAMGIRVPAKVSLSTSELIAKLVPKAPLALSSRYTVTLTSGITDKGVTPKALAPEEWTFTTALRPDDAPTPELAVYAFREQAAFFGHNAPKWETLPKPTPQTQRSTEDPYEFPWDQPPRPVWVDSQGSSYGGDTVYLERTIRGLEPRSWTIFESVSGAAPYFVTKVAEESLADYGISGRGARLTLSKRDGTSPSAGLASPPDFKTRETTAHVASERLSLVELPIEQPLEKGDTEILLDGMVVGLGPGKAIALRGELVDLPGVIGDEILLLEGSFHADGFTNLVLQTPLERSYVRKTVTLNANVVAATHGETVPNEILGGGDGAQPNQRFALKKPPLTYVSAATPSGRDSTLELRVDGVRWTEAPNLYELGPRDEQYIVRADDDGTTRVLFGDGNRGARLPTGTENVVATYRTGIGSAGLVGDERISLLQHRPLGIQSVTNPLPPSGPEDRENRDSARVNAPLTVLTMDRIVSLSDFEDFARVFAGIGKAQAVALRRGESQLVHLTIAAANGDEVAKTSALFGNLVKAVESSRDPGVVVAVDSYARMYFNIGASLLIDSRHTADAVLAAASRALEETYSFTRRDFGQPVTAAEVVTVLQGVSGVIAVDLNELYRVDEDAPAKAVVGLDEVITVDTARIQGANVLPAQLLMVNPGGIKLLEGTS
jgi:hypothetical protein